MASTSRSSPDGWSTSALPFAAELGLRDPIVAYQGALVREMPDPGRRLGRLVYHRPLPAAVARETISWTRAHGFDPHVNHLERFVIRAGDPRTDDYSTFLGRAGRGRPRPRALDPPPGLEGARRRRRRGPARRTSTPRGPTSPAGPRSRSATREFLEFLAPGVSKGQAVRWLARRLGIPLEQSMAIGDQYNDLEMIALAGHGVAMPSAPPAVRAAARYIAPPVEEEGAAQVDRGPRPRRSVGAAERRPPRGRRAGARRMTARVLPDDPRGPGRGDRRPASAASSSPCPPTRSTGSASRSARRGGLERLFAAKRRPLDKGIVLLLADHHQAEEVGELDAAAHVLAAAFWPGGLTIVVPQRPDVPAAVGADRWRPHDRPPAGGPRRPTSPGRRGRSAPGHLGEPHGARPGRRRRGRPRPSSATSTTSR